VRSLAIAAVLTFRAAARPQAHWPPRSQRQEQAPAGSLVRARTASHSPQSILHRSLPHVQRSATAPQNRA